MSEIEEIRASVQRIEACLTDDSAMGRVGLVSRVKDHHTRIKRLERVVVYLTGACGACLLILKIVEALHK